MRRPFGAFVVACAVLAGTPALAEPLILAPPAPPVSPTAVALDVALPSLTSAAALYFVMGGGIDAPGAQAFLIAGALVAPSAVLVGVREKPFTLDSYFASASAGVLGLLLGLGLARVALPADAGILRLPLLAIGQGLGAAAGYHAYLLAKPQLTDLNKLPEHRTDDPLNWDRWKERHHNE